MAAGQIGVGSGVGTRVYEVRVVEYAVMSEALWVGMMVTVVVVTFRPEVCALLGEAKSLGMRSRGRTSK